MRKLLFAIVTLGLLAQVSSPVHSQTPMSPTVCPTNSCSLVGTATEPLAGQPNDGHPNSIVGFLNFDGSGNLSGVLSLNENGQTVVNYPFSGGTCTSGTSTTLGQFTIPFKLPVSDKTFIYDFVTYATGHGVDLLLSGEGETNAPGDTAVSVGVCHASFAG
jgi:hypothetical protein